MIELIPLIEALVAFLITVVGLGTAISLAAAAWFAFRRYQL
jgi:uncharacterized membrane protein